LRKDSPPLSTGKRSPNLFKQKEKEIEKLSEAVMIRE
jgi:hypothetical protein